jgi:uncharacterized protein (DUF433 family)
MQVANSDASGRFFTMHIHEHPLCRDRIISDPEILGGKAVIKGTRISVALVLEKLAFDPDLTNLFRDYPRLTLDDVKACLAYAKMLAEEEDTKLKKPVSDRQEWEKALREAQEAWADIDTDAMIREIYRAREEGSGGHAQP